MSRQPYERFAFMAADTPEAKAAAELLGKRYGSCDPDDADVIVALGGDGLMLSCLHRFMSTGKPTFGMNRGSVGFLMNEFAVDDLPERVACADITMIRPLRMEAVDVDGEAFEARAINEVSLLRQTHQAAKLAIHIDGRPRLRELVCDGILLATPAGSTAYNLSAHGPILPINAQLLALTPISAFRPRRWRGALLPSHVTVSIETLERHKRPVAAAADHVEIRSVARVDIREDRTASCIIMFDPDHSWDERILAEQFTY
ncbi:NAD kinase [Acuticoccus mangrovi]|uniref:NAD kinase n=1 Tax=Acuticoccus mangrovi TaxID=2796142 RepID=A0A934MI44_9HYPH|nr:NAD kinase [Acuticoccus mangrovi]MBJ3776786.1 NAD kinase [Acuticoccus mangrovi]